jgi:tellurite methyltransferase
MGAIGNSQLKINMHSDSKNYWNSYYNKNLAPIKPSAFAEECFGIIKKGLPVLEIGCGNCRDSNFFSLKNPVIAVDQSSNKDFSDPKVFFIKSSIENLPDIKSHYIYSRFFLHAIDEDAENIFFDYIKRNCKEFFIEARSDKSIFVGDHYRRFINLNELEKKLDSYGFTFSYIESTGLAEFENDDPYIIRIFGKV